MLFVSSHSTASEERQPPRTDPVRCDWAAAIMGVVVLFLLGSVGEFLYPAGVNSGYALIDFKAFHASNEWYVFWPVVGLIAAAVILPTAWTLVRTIKYGHPDNGWYSSTMHDLVITSYVFIALYIASFETLLDLFLLQNSVISLYILIPTLFIIWPDFKKSIKE